MVSSVIWISVAIAVALLVALAVGLLLARRRRISIAEKPDQQVEAPPAPRRYQAGGSINFSSGGGGPPAPPKPPAPPQASAPAPPQAAAPAPPRPPAQAPSAPAPAPAPPKPQASAPAPAKSPPAPPKSSMKVSPEAPVRPQASAPAPPKPPEQAPSAPAAAPAPPKPPVQVPRDAPVRPQASAPAPPKPFRTTKSKRKSTPPTRGAAPAPTKQRPVAPAPPKPAPAESAPAQAAPPKPPAAKPAPAQPAPVQPAPTQPAPAQLAPAEPAAALVEPIDAPAGRLVRLRGRLAKSRSAFGQSLLGLLGAGDLDEDSWTDVEDTLLLADLGAATTTEIVDRLRAELAARAVRTPEQARAALRDVLIEALRPELDRAVRALPHEDADGVSVPGVVLIAGVNGTGKTTTTGKLARVLVAGGRRVLLGAADTFRAAAVDQLATWGERAGATVVRGAEGADPASVAFDAVKRGSVDGVDTVLIDTAGRLHTKTGLMDELGKVKRVISKQTEVDEVLLVLDATTGQNGIMQARVFREVVDVTGIVLTKLDGTAKGGIVFHVQRELGVPVKLVGLGEGVDDLAPFEPAAFVDALLD
ncbi:MAG TPA: signal recognition particle-docking protein FtsY [Pseudonocardiaceae bacterium]|nr:signal recognition particle-docking protein FtsY [Pseudonocardiaceae bacterium]